MIKKFDNFKVNEDVRLKDLSDKKALAERAIELHKELTVISDEMAKLNGYDNWREWGRELGYSGEVNLFDQSTPESRVEKLNDYLEDYFEDYKKDKIVDLHRSSRDNNPNIPG